MECSFVFSSSAEIPVVCPREQCPLHVFSLEVVSPKRLPAGISIAWRFSGNSTKVTVFPKNTWPDTPLSSFPLPFICPFLFLVIFYFIYLFFFHSFTYLFYEYMTFPTHILFLFYIYIFYFTSFLFLSLILLFFPYTVFLLNLCLFKHLLFT